MRQLIAIVQVSLDGVMQAPGGPEEDPSNGFAHGGWAMHFGDEVLHQVVQETMAGEFDLLLGRRTYDIWTGYWPHHLDNPIGQAFDRATKYVASRTLERLEWGPAERLGEDVVAELRRVKSSAGPDLHLWGSSNLLQTLIAAELIDEYRLWVMPVMLGGGKRLFEDGVPPSSLALVESRGTTTGVLINTYRPAGPLPTESS